VIAATKEQTRKRNNRPDTRYPTIFLEIQRIQRSSVCNNFVNCKQVLDRVLQSRSGITEKLARPFENLFNKSAIKLKTLEWSDWI